MNGARIDPKEIAEQVRVVVLRRLGDVAHEAVRRSLRQRGGHVELPGHAGPWLDAVTIAGRPRLMLCEWTGRGFNVTLDPLGPRAPRRAPRAGRPLTGQIDARLDAVVSEATLPPGLRRLVADAATRR